MRRLVNIPDKETSLADDMLALAEEITRQVMANREEILEAFVAKYGFAPDECMQIHQGNSWCVVRIDPDAVAKLQRAMILSRLGSKRYGLWQRFCFWMAGVK